MVARVSIIDPQAPVSFWATVLIHGQVIQEGASDPVIYIYILQRGTEDSLAAIWLINCFNCYQFSWPS